MRLMVKGKAVERQGIVWIDDGTEAVDVAGKGVQRGIISQSQIASACLHSAPTSISTHIVTTTSPYSVLTDSIQL